MRRPFDNNLPAKSDRTCDHGNEHILLSAQKTPRFVAWTMSSRRSYLYSCGSFGSSFHVPIRMKPVATSVCSDRSGNSSPASCSSTKPIEWHVLIECLNHPVAVLPSVWLDLIPFVPARFRETDNVQPIASPAFTIAGRREQSVHKSLVGVRRGILNECLDLFMRGRQANEIKVNSS